MAMDSASERRLRTIFGHIASRRNGDQANRISAATTAGEFVLKQDYSVVLPEKLQTGKWNIYRSARSPFKLVDGFPDHPEIKTLHDNFEYAVDAFQDLKYLGTRIRADESVGEYKWMTYGEAGTSRTAIGSGLVCHGIPKGACIGIYLINRPEWSIVDYACCAYSYISVPLYDTLGLDAVQYIVKHASVLVVFCATQTLTTLLSFLSQMPSVRLVVVVGGFEKNMLSLPSFSGVEIISYSKLHEQGLKSVQSFCPPKPDDVATICYTSGSTGTPKGALLTHGNLIANSAAILMCMKVYSSDIHISYLPLAHMYERVNQINYVHHGASVGFYQGDILKLFDDIAALRPTMFVGVPRLYNRLYASVFNAVKASGGLKERLFNVAYNAKLRAISQGKIPSPVWDRLVFNKIREKLGGRIRLMGSGASPLSPDVMDFLRVCFGGRILEGYGMTEASCAISMLDDGDMLTGHVGSPIPACEIKLVDVPEMNFTSDDQPHPRGEICVRGPIVFKGYYKDDVQTKEVIDEDGWLHTGDIGLWLPGGRLKIIDRKKSIFKLAQGEYIAPEKIENVYAKCKFVSQCFVFGDSLNSCLVAVVAVDHDALIAWAAPQGMKYNDVGQLCCKPEVRAAVLADMDEVGKQAQLRGFEFVKAVTLVAEPFSLENGLLTPTFKIKRPQAKAYFANAIMEMYSGLSASQQKLI